MTDSEKVASVCGSPEIINATTLLIALFKDLELKSHIRFAYTLEDGEKYEIIFLPIKNETTVQFNQPTP